MAGLKLFCADRGDDEWHPQFCDSFVVACSDMEQARCHAVALSNEKATWEIREVGIADESIAEGEVITSAWRDH